MSIGNAVSPYVSQNLGANKTQRIKKGYHAALVLDVCFAALAFLVIETLHMQISSLFLGKDGTALAYQVSGDYMRWLGYFFIFMGIKMATDGVLRLSLIHISQAYIALDKLPPGQAAHTGLQLSQVERDVYKRQVLPLP